MSRLRSPGPPPNKVIVVVKLPKTHFFWTLPQTTARPTQTPSHYADDRRHHGHNLSGLQRHRPENPGPRHRRHFWRHRRKTDRQAHSRSPGHDSRDIHQHTRTSQPRWRSRKDHHPAAAISSRRHRFRHRFPPARRHHKLGVGPVRLRSPLNVPAGVPAQHRHSAIHVRLAPPGQCQTGQAATVVL